MALVAVDAMGGDHAPRVVVQGAVVAACETPDLSVALVGRVSELRPLLPDPPPNVRLVDAPDAVAMAEHPVSALRQKPRSSILVSLQMVKRGEAAACVSFGNTGAMMAAALVTLGRIPGVDRPALGAIFQNARGTVSLVLDVGANVDCRPAYLLQFAIMGKAYMARVLHHRNPSVALLNVGEEETKGNQFAQEAHQLLQQDEPNFIGNVDGTGVVQGSADIVVCDGFNGNVVVKISEGVADLITSQLRQTIRSRLRYAAGAWLLRGAFASMHERIDYQQVGGAPLFGVNGAVIIGHGRADAEAVASGIRLAHDVGRSTFVETMHQAFSEAAAAGGRRPRRSRPERRRAKEEIRAD